MLMKPDYKLTWDRLNLVEAVMGLESRPYYRSVACGTKFNEAAARYILFSTYVPVPGKKKKTDLEPVLNIRLSVAACTMAPALDKYDCKIDGKKARAVLTNNGPHHFVKADLTMNFQAATRSLTLNKIEKTWGERESMSARLDLKENPTYVETVIDDFATIVKKINTGNAQPFNDSVVARASGWTPLNFILNPG